MGSTQLKDTDEVCEVIVINDICVLIYKEDSVAFFFWRENEGGVSQKRNLATG